jgi:hypothetical protein
MSAIHCVRAAVAASALLAVVVGAPSAAQVLQESANGHGTLTSFDENGSPRKRQFSFTAKRQPDGTVKGQAQLVNPAFGGSGSNNAPYQLHVDISCMKVVGNIAIMGGTTKRTNDANLVDAVYFTVQDNGEPGKGRDLMSRAFFFDDNPGSEGDPQLCLLTGPQDFPLEPIEAGNIQVRAQ